MALSKKDIVAASAVWVTMTLSMSSLIEIKRLSIVIPNIINMEQIFLDKWACICLLRVKYVHPSLDQPYTLHPVVILGDKTTYFQLCCVGVKDRSINDQCLIYFMTSFVIGALVNILYFLVFILSFIYLSRKKIKKSSRILGREVRLFWGFIFLLNVYVFTLTSKSLCFNW